MNDTATHVSRHPALRGIVASGPAARAIERTAHRFTHRPEPGQPKDLPNG
jgi:hypothetical protein